MQCINYLATKKQTSGYGFFTDNLYSNVGFLILIIIFIIKPGHRLENCSQAKEAKDFFLLFDNFLLISRSLQILLDPILLLLQKPP